MKNEWITEAHKKSTQRWTHSFTASRQVDMLIKMTLAAFERSSSFWTPDILPKFYNFTCSLMEKKLSIEYSFGHSTKTENIRSSVQYLKSVELPKLERYLTETTPSSSVFRVLSTSIHRQHSIHRLLQLQILIFLNEIHMKFTWEPFFGRHRLYWIHIQFLNYRRLKVEKNYILAC